MKRASNRLLFTHLICCVSVVACESEIPRKKQPVGDKPTVASFPGIVQVGQVQDPLIDEMTACARFRAALSTNVERLTCVDFVVQECPDLVHPLVDLPCVMYSETSVSECEQKFAQAKSCDGLRAGSCVLTAILDPTDAQGTPLECAERDPTSTDLGSSSTPDAGASSNTDASASTVDAAVTDSVEAGATPESDAGDAAATSDVVDASANDATSTLPDAGSLESSSIEVDSSE